MDKIGAGKPLPLDAAKGFIFRSMDGRDRHSQRHSDAGFVRRERSAVTRIKFILATGSQCRETFFLGMWIDLFLARPTKMYRPPRGCKGKGSEGQEVL